MMGSDCILWVERFGADVKKPKRWFTLRNQIFISFMLLMIFVLGIASVLT